MRIRWAVTAAMLAGVLLAACAAPATGRAGDAGTTAASSADNASSDAGPVGSVQTVGPSSNATTDPLSQAEESLVDTPTPASTPASAGTPVKATSQPLPGCDPKTLRTRTAGGLTFATDTPTAPWFTSSNPADGAGFEAAVAAAVADRLGYGPTAVSWVEATKARALAGTDDDFDAFIGQVTIPDQPGPGVSYSTGYLDDATVLVAKEGSPAAGAKSQADLAGLDLVVLRGTLLPTTVTGKAVTGTAQIDSGLDTADGALVPLSLVPQVEAATGAAPVARLAPPAGQQPRQLGMVLPAASPLGSCLSAAIDTMRVDGTLQDLAEHWLPGAATPELATD